MKKLLISLFLFMAISYSQRPITPANLPYYISELYFIKTHVDSLLPADSSTIYIEGYLTTANIDTGNIGYLPQAESITGNWVNTTFPWAENELVSTVLVESDLNTFSELQALVADKTLVNEEDIFQIDANWSFTDSVFIDTLQFNIIYGLDSLNVDSLNFVPDLEYTTGLGGKADSALVGYLAQDESVTGTWDFNSIQINPTASQSYVEGLIYYDSDDNTLIVYNDESEVAMNVGEEMWKHVRNVTGATIVDGTPVYITGATGQIATIDSTDADIDVASLFAGLTTHDIENNSNGYITVFGIVRGLDTDGSPYGESWSDGDQLYISQTEGWITNIRPSGANVVCFGSVDYAHTTLGRIQVHPVVDWAIDFKTTQLVVLDSAFIDTLEFNIIYGLDSLNVDSLNFVPDLEFANYKTALDTGNIGYLNQAETIAGDWINTDNPWAENELVSTVLVESNLNTFSELQSLVSDKTLINEEDDFTITGLYVFSDSAYIDTLQFSRIYGLDSLNVDSLNFVPDLEMTNLKATTMTAGDGLRGGGDLSASRTFIVNLDFDGGLETTDDSINVKLDGTTLVLSSSGLKINPSGTSAFANITVSDSAFIDTLEFNIAYGGTIKTGLWNGTSISDTYIDNNITIDNLSGTNTGDNDIMENGVSVSSAPDYLDFLGADFNLTDGTTADSVAIVIDDGGIDHNSTANYDANEHVDHTGVDLTAGDGLRGGGTIASNRTFIVNLDFDGGLETTDDSINVKLDGSTLTVGASGLKITADYLLKSAVTDSVNSIVDSSFVDALNFVPDLEFVAYKTVLDTGNIGYLQQAESIVGNWDNTNVPWVDNEVDADLTITSTKKISTTLTSEQLRLSYDASNYYHIAVDAEGRATHTTVDADAAEGDIVFMPDGNIGIGDATPDDKLDIASGNLRFSTSDYGIVSSGIRRLDLISDAGANSFKINDDTGGDTWFHINTSSNYALFPTGNVGIGTASPGEKLDITGNVHLTGDIHQKSPVAPIFYRHTVGIVNITDNTWQTIASVPDAINQKGFFHFRGFTSRSSANADGYSHSVSAVGAWTIDSGSNFLASGVAVQSSKAEDGMTGTATFQTIEAGGNTVVQIKSDNSSDVAWDVFGEVVVMAYENSGDTNQVPSF